MAWKTDQEPIDYLKRRVIYYKKKRAQVKGFIHNKGIVKTYERPKLIKLIKSRTTQIDSLIEMFENAIKKLT